MSVSIPDLDPLGGPPAATDELIVMNPADHTQASTGSTLSMTVANLFTSPAITTPSITGNVIVTGQITTRSFGLSVDNSLTPTALSTVTAASGTTTAAVAHTMANTGNSTILGVESSAGSFLLSGTQAFATVLGTSSSRSLQLATNNAVRLTIDSTGTVAIAGAATAASVAVTGGLTSSSPTAGIGYATGAGSTVTQSVNVNNTVTINAMSGTINMAAGTFSATSGSEFIVNNSSVGANDTPVVVIKSGSAGSSLSASVKAVSAGSFVVTITNVLTGAIPATLVLSFNVMKGVAA